MTPVQLSTLAAHIRANANPDVVSARNVRDDGALAAWYNSPSVTKAWSVGVERPTLFGALNLTNYDGLSAGKRDAFRLIFDSCPVDFSNDKIRAGIVDIFSVVDEAVILNAATELALNIETVFGGASATSGTVTAIKRIVVGAVHSVDISEALNRY